MAAATISVLVEPAGHQPLRREPDRHQGTEQNTGVHDSGRAAVAVGDRSSACAHRPNPATGWPRRGSANSTSAGLRRGSQRPGPPETDHPGSISQP